MKDQPGLGLQRTASGQRRIRLLFVENHRDTFFSHRLGLARAAARAGFEVHVALPPSGEDQAVGPLPSGRLPQENEFTLHTIPLTRQNITPWTEFKTIVHLTKLYQSLRPDLVHHLRFKPIIYGSIAAHLVRVPGIVNCFTGLSYVFIARGLKASLVRWVVKAGFFLAMRGRNQRVIFQNPDDRDTLVRLGICKPEWCSVIKGSGVDMQALVRQPDPDGTPVVVMACRMIWLKGVRQFVDAAAQLSHEGLKARFVLVGGPDVGNPSAIPVSQLQDWHDSGLVEWWGWRGDMDRVLAESNIVCLPTNYCEGVPRVLIEAAATGRPIVATDAPGCREVVRHQVNGFLVRPNDQGELVNALRTLIENAALRRTFGDRSREIAVQEFGEQLIAEQTLCVYDRLLQSASLRLGSLRGKQRAIQNLGESEVE